MAERSEAKTRSAASRQNIKQKIFRRDASLSHFRQNLIGQLIGPFTRNG